MCCLNTSRLLLCNAVPCNVVSYSVDNWEIQADREFVCEGALILYQMAGAIDGHWSRLSPRRQVLSESLKS